MKAYIFDAETNGLLKKLDRMHVLAMRNIETRETFVYRHNDEMNTIAEGVQRLEDADLVVGHNVIGFDLKAIQKLFPDFKLKSTCVVRDTLVLCRVAAPDIKQTDFQLWKKGLLPGHLVGSHKLEAWGRRIGKFKGDYAKEMAAKGLDPWANWNQEQEDYCVGDLDVTEVLWHLVAKQEIAPMCVELEHEIHTLCGRMEENGFPFDKGAAEALTAQLRSTAAILHEKIVADYGQRLVPKTKKQIASYWDDPEGKNAAKEYKKPDPELGESYERTWWAGVDIPKKDYTHNGFKYAKDAPHSKVLWVEFNPGSRQQVVQRLVEDHNWRPVDFTETGQPSVDAAALEVLGKTVPVAKDIGELFFIRKILGQVADGPQAWLKQYDEETGCIHAYTDTGGTVTGRCTHSRPNIGQVPSVMSGKLFLKDGSKNPQFLLPNGDWHPRVFKKDGTLKKEAPLFGRDGEFGWECRSMFGVPDDWLQVGTDLSGIEFRALAHLVAQFDKGELVEVVLSGDIHAYNMEKTGIPSRDIIKRVLYGLLYGAGDEKLGITAKPTATPMEAKQIGGGLRAQLMQGLPALKRAIDQVKAEARRGYLIGLDGRRIRVRSEHSALNTRLQSDAALIAKKWLVLTDQYARQRGMLHDWNDINSGPDCLGDYALMAFVHDEQQNAVAPEYAEEFAELTVRAAKDAGEFFNFRCPVGAEAKIGKNWAECH